MTREEAIKQFMMNQMSDRSEDLGFYLLGEIYDDFESRICENCKHGESEDLGIYCPFVNYCGSDYMEKDFGCNKFEYKTVSTDIKSH